MIPRERKIAIAVDLQLGNLSYREIARKHNVSDATVRKIRKQPKISEYEMKVLPDEERIYEFEVLGSISYILFRASQAQGRTQRELLDELHRYVDNTYGTH